MYEVRMPNLTVTERLNSNVASNLADYTRKMLQVSSGQLYSSRSENTVATSEAASLNISASQLESWQSNMDAADSWETITDSNVQTILDTMQRLNEIITEANSTINTASTADRAGFVEEINSILESLVQSGNARYQGNSIFAGTATCDDPFTVDRDANGNITTVYFLGSDDVTVTPATSLRKVSSGDGTYYEMGLLGEGASPSLFRYITHENLGTDAAPNWQDVDVRLFDELITFRDTLADATQELDETNLTRLQAALDNVTSCSVTVSTNLTTVSQIKENLTNVYEVTVNQASALTDVDASVAITELYTIQTALQASMKMINKINDMSILNYIS